MIARFGCQLEIVSDQATHFRNETMNTMIEELMIKHSNFSHYYPRFKGQAKSTNKTLKGLLTKIVQDQTYYWDKKLVSTLYSLGIPNTF